MNELSKLKVVFEDVSDDVLSMRCPERLPYFSEEEYVTFDNYKDHRIAMALVPLVMKSGHIEMENPEVVSKSYPMFFDSIGLSTK